MRFPPVSAQSPLILASASPRRRRLLSQIGLPFRVMESNVKETNTGESPERICCVLAEHKALSVYPETEASWVLGADTVVAIENSILGKPMDDRDATRMLGCLSGKEHRVITGFCVLNPSGETAHTEAVTTFVRVKKLTKKEIKEYVATGEPYGKAGSYAIQGIGAFMVEAISGSYTNVVGLPLCAVIKSLFSIGALKSFPNRDLVFV